MLLLGLLALMLLTLLPALGQETPKAETKKPWTGKLANGRVITHVDLDKILQANDLWRESNHKEGKRADLGKAELNGANIEMANLSWTNFEKANLSGATLNAVNLTHANLIRGQPDWGPAE